MPNVELNRRPRIETDLAAVFAASLHQSCDFAHDDRLIDRP